MYLGKNNIFKERKVILIEDKMHAFPNVISI